MILDKGGRTVQENGFKRVMQEGKGRMDLLPWNGIMDLSKHCEEGAKKYGERNIDLGAPQKSLIDSAFRHLAKYHIGMTDESHLRACAWNILWALEQEVCRPDLIKTYRDEMKGPKVNDVEELHNNRVNEALELLSEIREAYWRFKIDAQGNAGMTLLNELDKLFSECGGPDPEVAHSNDEENVSKGFTRRCVESTCFNNVGEVCTSSMIENVKPELGQDCPGFMED